MTKIQRIRKVCKWLIFIDYADNDTDLAKKLGYTKSSFSQIMNGKVPLSDKFINAVVNTNENINIVWINEEKGEMLLKAEESDEDLNLLKERLNGYKELNGIYLKKIDYLQSRLDECKSEKKRV